MNAQTILAIVIVITIIILVLARSRTRCRCGCNCPCGNDWCTCGCNVDLVMKFEPVELPAIGTKVVMGVEAKPIHHKSRYNHVGTWTQEPPRVLLFTEPIYSQHGEGTLCTAPECGGEMSEVSESFVDRINNTRRVYLHYTNWCGFCTKMKPVWAQVKETLAESAIEFYEVDEDVAKTPGVNGYPTILMIDENGYRHQYPGGSDFTTLREWCVAPALQKTN